MKTSEDIETSQEKIFKSLDEGLVEESKFLNVQVQPVRLGTGGEDQLVQKERSSETKDREEEEDRSEQEATLSERKVSVSSK